MAPVTDDPVAAALARYGADIAQMPPEARPAVLEDSLEAVLHDPARVGSLAFVLNSLARVASTVRDRISADMWRVINHLGSVRRQLGDVRHDHHAEFVMAGEVFAGSRDGPTLSEQLDRLDRMILTLAAFGGLAMESVTRSEGWRFLDMGRKLERSLNMIGLLRTTLVPAMGQDGPLLEALLEVADSLMTYRRRYQESLQTEAVLDLLLTDDTNPRSLAFQMAAMADDVEHLPRADGLTVPSREEQLMTSALVALRGADVFQLVEVIEGERRIRLDGLLGQLGAALTSMSDAITQTYLSHLQTSRHLASYGDHAPT